MQVVVRDLAKRFQGNVAVDQVSFSVEKGRLLTLLGPSGSGKTTTLMMIAGFVEPDAGGIEIAGRDVTRLPPNRRELGVVFQSYALFPHKTVFDNIAFPLEIRKRPRSEIAPRVARLLNMMKLTALRDRGIGQISGGQKQRVALARALVFEPPVLLMDEPLGALDKKLREELQTEIKALQRSLGVTAIYVTHDQEEAMAMSDAIAIMNDGRIVQMGTPDQLYEAPANRFVAQFLGGINLFRTLDLEHGEDGVCATIEGGIRVPCGRPAVPENGPSWVGIRPERVSLVESGGRERALFDATVIRSTYLGGAMLYILRNTAGVEFSARVPVGGARRTLAAGVTVGVSWMPDDARLLG
jgi:spermidine/putrescine ABC transporter ATP-binding subunit